MSIQTEFRPGRRTVIRLAATALAAPYAMAGVARAQPPSPTSPTAPPVLTPEQARRAVSVMADADSHGLTAKLYVPASEDPAAVTKSLLRYARDVHRGRLADADFPKLWAMRPPAFDPAPALSQALSENRFDTWLDDLPPPYAGYQQLRKALAAYREIAQQGGWTPVPEGDSLKLGATGPRVDAVRARLRVEEDQVAETGSFDALLEEAVMRAQRRAGLEPDGVVGPATLRAFNRSADERVRQIIVNMERWRWLPHTMPTNRVQVNSGAAIVTLFKDDRPVLSMKAVSGKPGDETPMLTSDIHSIVLNPPWNVPSSIANDELWPKERANPGYFARNGFRVIKTDSGTRLQQRSEQSALGRFKFDFDNPFAVYLHDTPAKSAFERFSRQASHGCVRVEKPAELAKALLADDPEWSGEAITAAIDKGDTVRARLPEPVPVFILYWTAFVGADGVMNFRADPYGWDDLLMQKIEGQRA